jgi:thymidylate synthase ThyX
MSEERVVWRTTQATDITNLFEVQLLRTPASQVHLVSKTENPSQLVAKVTNTYKGILDPYDIEDPAVIRQAFEDMSRTKLQTPTEMLHFLFLIKGVTRAFTHQLVRYRIGTSFAQESMRFYGKHKIYKVLITGNCATGGNIETYGRGIAGAILAYETLVDKGVPSEDARGLLPTNILTDIYFDVSMRTLQNIYTQRMCCQAQPGEWQPIMKAIKTLITAECGEDVGNMLSAPYERGVPCGYRASFDRPCIWSNKNAQEQV